MSKLRLDIDSLTVESFASEPDPAGNGTVYGRDDNTNLGDFCTGDCTGLGSECYTDDPAFTACTGGHPCTGVGAACTNAGTCGGANC